MREQVEERLKTLKTEFKAGQDMLTELDARQSNLKITMTRISGAIQVLEELLSQQAQPSDLIEAAATSKTAATAGTSD